MVLLRGVNVGGKNIIPMAALKLCLAEQGFGNVATHIQSGNVLLRSDYSAAELGRCVEAMLPTKFRLDSSAVKVLVLTRQQLQAVIKNKPEGFGEQPAIYHSDVIFLMGIDIDEALQVFNPREGVDKIWPGDGVIYSQRLSSQRTRSRLSRIVGTHAYRSMTIRNWNTTTKLLELMQAREA